MPSVGDVRVELPAAGGEALDVPLPVEDNGAVSDEQRSRLYDVTGGVAGHLVERPQPDLVVDDRDARTPRSEGLGHGLVLHASAVDHQLAERPVRVAEEETADDRLVDAVRHAPDVEPLRLGKVHDAYPRGRARMPDRVHGGLDSTGQPSPREQVLDLVHPGPEEPR